MPEPLRRPGEMTRRRFLVAGAALTVAGASTLNGCSGTKNHNVQIVRDNAVPYGTQASQVGDLSVPQLDGRRPVIMLIHGGYWTVGFDRRSLDPLADNLASAGFAVWNIDYRCLGEVGGGWPGTFEDVADAIDKVASFATTKPLDLDRVGVLGHSAGGQLAMWSASRATIPTGQPGAGPELLPRAAVSLAGVLDMQTAALGSADTNEELRNAVIDVIEGTPAQQPDRYGVVSPISRLPIGVPQLLVHGAKDIVVPIEQSRAYVARAAQVKENVRFIELPNSDHADVIRIDKPGWDEVVTWLRLNVGDPAPK